MALTQLFPDSVVKEFSIDVEQGENWISVPCNAEQGADGKVYIVFRENKDIEIAVGKNRPVGAVTFRMHSEKNNTGNNHDSIPLSINSTYIAMDHHYEKNRNILFRNITPKPHMYSAGKVLSGYGKPYKEANMWIAQKDFPQTLTLTACSPTYAKKLSIVFDDLLEDDSIQQFPACLAKDFDLEVKTATSDKHFEIKSNCQRVCNFDIDAQITEVKITIKESYGSDVHIFGIRIK